MKPFRPALGAALLLALAGAGSGQGVGTSIPAKIELEGLSQTPALSFEDFRGRAVLFEFFAYW